MKFMVIGLGSMGKRRVRNLKSLGCIDVVGYDVREDRRKEAEELYGIKTVSSLINCRNPDAVIISTPPDKHDEYIKYAIENGNPSFVELSLVKNNLVELNSLARSKKLLIAPSCTFRFHPSIRMIKKLVQEGVYGKITDFTYHSGQHLADWHPWENISDYFVSKRETSGCKEIFSFEMHWMVDVFGKPDEMLILQEKTTDFNADIDDVYAFCLKYRGCVGLFLADVVSRFATRSLILNLERAQVRWNWEERKVRLYDAEKKEWEHYCDSSEQSESGYNENIGEGMYRDEMRTFIDAVRGMAKFPLSLDEVIDILGLVERIK